MAREVVVATLAQIPEGCMRPVSVEGVSVVLYRVNGEVFASSNVCPHQGAPLSEGLFDGGEVTCPLHAWEFDVRNGECLSNPDWPPLQVYDVRVEGDRVVIAV